jgi:hypothetical protein
MVYHIQKALQYSKISTLGAYDICLLAVYVFTEAHGAVPFDALNTYETTHGDSVVRLMMEMWSATLERTRVVDYSFDACNY